MTLVELALGGSALLAATAAALSVRRFKVYKGLRRHHAEIAKLAFSDQGQGIAARQLPSFENALATLTNVLPAARLDIIRDEVEKFGKTERSFVPTHKKGGTIAYETLCVEAPAVVQLYLSPELHELISGIVGEKVVPTPLHDQSSCSVLIYERPGDHIGWHYDHNFYRGRHFTVLLPLVNRNADGSGLSAARLMVRIGGEERIVPTPPNTLVVFEGARVLHKATPIDEGELRIVLSMTFATDPSNSLAQGIARRIKDTAFFGIRALWT
jgi:hypothetical protein